MLARAEALARRLSQGPSAAYAASKRLVLVSYGRTIHEALEAEAIEQTACGATADHAAAVTAFLTRQTPTFAGR